uniref:Uncharacterized protein n=1 Tax=Rangifer tarandus platyrhynchus TaxID=3082113 RepID=A0ACB0EUI2_RANTA|nr:unnamed protein product [Rangifer tarandus platyrhynchus]
MDSHLPLCSTKYRTVQGTARLREPRKGSEPAPGKVALGAQHTRGTGDPRTRIPPSPPRRECATGRAGPRLLKGGLAATRNSRPYLFLAEKPPLKPAVSRGAGKGDRLTLPRGRTAGRSPREAALRRALPTAGASSPSGRSTPRSRSFQQ